MKPAAVHGTTADKQELGTVADRGWFAGARHWIKSAILPSSLVLGPVR